MSNRGTLRLMWLGLILCLAALPTASANVTGVVLGPGGGPVPANIAVYSGNELLAEVVAGSDGFFSLSLPEGEYQILIYWDDPKTPGWDALPQVLESSEDLGRISLTPGATIRVEGLPLFVDTEEIPSQTLYIVQEAGGGPIALNGFPLVFPDLPKPNSPLGLEPGELIAPSNTRVDLNISCNILVGHTVDHRHILLQEVQTPSPGGVLELDAMEGVALYNLGLVESVEEELREALEVMRGYGFYVYKQEAAWESGLSGLEEARSLLNSGDYGESYKALKRAYMDMEYATNQLHNMLREAKTSTHGLLVFLSLAALFAASMLSDSFTLRTLIGLGLLAAASAFFHWAFPGSKATPIQQFALTPLLSYMALTLLSLYLPRFLGSRGGGRQTSVLALLEPIYEIAKRSLRRRKLRFTLTLAAISFLVMSFVAFTSVSQGYGVNQFRFQPSTPWRGVFIRNPGWTEDEPVFIDLSPRQQLWLSSLQGVKEVAPLAANPPMRNPLMRLKGQTIFGVLGISPGEPLHSQIAGVFEEGAPPKSGEVAVSRVFAREVGLSVGDTLQLGLDRFTVSGIFSDSGFRMLKDLDGKPLGPGKLVNHVPPPDPPMWELEPAEPWEVLVFHVEDALRLPGVGVQRVAIQVEEGLERGVAEALALERGFKAWYSSASGSGGFWLGRYLEGSGGELIAPWIVVVLNIVATMLNSMYERAKEVNILSSVGLNPAQISSIFVGEAAITAFMGGGLGYLMGLALYKVSAALSMGLVVQQKVSVVWSLASVALSFSAIATGAFVALKRSVVITPSLLRRWRVPEKKVGLDEPWRISIPIRLKPGEEGGYLAYLEKQLKAMGGNQDYTASSVAKKDGALDFVFKSVQTPTGGLYTRNRVMVVPLDGELGVELLCYGDRDWAHIVGSVVRRLSVEYTT